MPGTPAPKGGVAEANEHLRQLYGKIDELEVQLQSQVVYREHLSKLQNDNLEMKETIRKLQIQNQELIHYLRERSNEVSKLQTENKQLVEIVSDLANQRKVVDDWISLTNRAAHTVNQLASFNKFKRSKSKEFQTSSSVTNGVVIVDESLHSSTERTDPNQSNHDSVVITSEHCRRKISDTSKRPILPNNQ